MGETLSLPLSQLSHSTSVPAPVQGYAGNVPAMCDGPFAQYAPDEISSRLRNRVVGSNTHLTGFRHSHYDPPQ
jgi:hypothetical protein